MTHDPILDALRDLPRERAGPAFTARLLARARAAGRPARRPAAVPLAVAAALAAAAAGAGLWQLDHQRDRRARLEALRAEQRQLAGELAELRDLTAAADDAFRGAGGETAGYLFLGGDDRFDIVLPVLAGVSVATPNEPAR